MAINTEIKLYFKNFWKLPGLKFIKLAWLCQFVLTLKRKETAEWAHWVSVALRERGCKEPREQRGAAAAQARCLYCTCTAITGPWTLFHFHLWDIPVCHGKGHSHALRKDLILQIVTTGLFLERKKEEKYTFSVSVDYPWTHAKGTKLSTKCGGFLLSLFNKIRNTL